MKKIINLKKLLPKSLSNNLSKKESLIKFDGKVLKNYEKKN